LVQLAQEHLKRSLKGYNVQVDCAANLTPLQVDISLLEQAIANILLNAAQYTPEGGVIQVQVTQNESELQIAISDQGPGIPPEYLGRIFDKFYRYPGSKGQGAGIGLAVAKGLVRVHEGKISVTNLPQGGACFTITLPLPKT
jgi:two-component system sensor histidine kinase KdpD